MVLLAAGVVVALKLKNKNKPAEQQTQNEPQAIINRQEVPKTERPANVPKDIPVEKSAEITANNNIEFNGIKEGQTQYTSNKTLAENYKTYMDYLAKNNWEIVSNMDTENFKAITARKNGETFSGIFDLNSTTGKVNVNIMVESK